MLDALTFITHTDNISDLGIHSWSFHIRFCLSPRTFDSWGDARSLVMTSRLKGFGSLFFVSVRPSRERIAGSASLLVLPLPSRSFQNS